jgi:protein-S-isoprenylcysteine O-methyltransferase Ste14
MYSAHILFIAPATTSFSRSWIAFTTPFAMYVIFRRRVNKEELYFEGQFGEDYLPYKSKVNRLLPSFKLFKLS